MKTSSATARIRFGLGQPIGGHAEAGVADSLAEQQDAVRALDSVAQWLGRHDAEIGADELRVARRKDTAAQERRGHRHVQPFGEPDDLFAEPEPMDLDADDDDGLPGVAESREDFLRGFFDGAFVDAAGHRSWPRVA